MQDFKALKILDSTRAPQQGSWPFYLVVLFLVLEYSRPQEYIPGFGSLHLPAVISIFLALSLFSSHSFSLSEKQAKLFLMMLVFMVFHVPIAVNNYWAFEVTKIMATYFVVYLGIITYIDSLQKFRRLMTMWIAIHLLLGVNGILKGGVGIGGWLGDENDFALVMNMIIPFAFFMALSEAKKMIPYMIFLLIFLYAMMSSFSRGGFVGLIAAGTYCWLRAPGTKKVLSTVFVALMIIFVRFYGSDQYWQRIQSIQEASEPGGTGEDRMYEWKIGWQMFLANPILGVGQGNFPWTFREYEIAEGFSEGLNERSRAGRAAHSLYFTLIPELGLVGIFLFLGMLICVWKDLRLIRKLVRKEVSQDQRSETNTVLCLRYAMVGSLIGFFVSGAFISVLYYPCLWMLMAFITALRKIMVAHDEEYSTSY